MTRSEERRVTAEPKLLYQQDPLRKSLQGLGSKWTLLILRDVGYLGLDRFGQILRNNPGLSPRVLSRRLRQMQEEGLIERTVSLDEVKYHMTSRGEDAFYILLAFLRYGLKYHTSDRVVQDAPSFSSLLKSAKRFWPNDTATR